MVESSKRVYWTPQNHRGDPHQEGLDRVWKKATLELRLERGIRVNLIHKGIE